MKPQKKYQTVLRYPGGKSRITWYLFSDKMLPTEPIKEYREGFLGGGSCALTFSEMYPDTPVWVNDLYYNLYIFWTQLQSNADDLVNKMLEVKDSCGDGAEGHRKVYGEMRDLIRHTKDPFEIAYSFYTLNRMSFGGFTEQGANSFTDDCWRGKIFNKNKIANLMKASKLMSNWKITNQCYSTLMKEPGEGVFVFLDPPYLIKDMLYGKNKEMHTGFSHEDFVQNCKDCSHNWQITYNDDPWLREQFADFNCETFEFTYSMVHRVEEGNKNKKEELLVMNYTPDRDNRGVLPF